MTLVVGHIQGYNCEIQVTTYICTSYILTVLLTSQFLSLLFSFNLTQHVDFPAHNKNYILDLVITASDSGGLARRETGRFPGGPLIQEFFRPSVVHVKFISLIISWHSRQTGSAFSARAATCAVWVRVSERWVMYLIHSPAGVRLPESKLFLMRTKKAMHIAVYNNNNNSICIAP